MDGLGGKIIRNTAGGIANAASRSAIDGTDFGDNLIAALPSVIGNTIGNLVAQGVAGGGPSSSGTRAQGSAGGATVAGRSGASGSGAPDDLPPIDGVQGGDEIVVTGRRASTMLFVPQGYSPLSMMTNVLYDSGGFLPADANVLEWAKPRTSALTRLLKPSHLKWMRRASGIGAAAELLFDAAPAGVGHSIPLFGENATLDYTAPNLFDGYSIVSNGSGIGFAPTTDLEGVFLIQGAGGVLGTISGNNAIVTRTIDVGGDQIQVGFGVSIQSRREGEIYNEGIANGWSNDRINNAISAERSAPVDGGGDFRLADMRYVPGTAFSSGALIDADRSWLATGSGAVPEQVAARLRGREFGSAAAFRKAFWKTVADIPELAAGFRSINIERMRAGNAPFAVARQQVGGQRTFQIHHPEQIRYGGAVYDMSNMLVVTPRIHNDLHRANR